jgi:hypothetical protein
MTKRMNVILILITMIKLVVCIYFKRESAGLELPAPAKHLGTFSASSSIIWCLELALTPLVFGLVKLDELKA